jgi:hypothetical protein
MRKFDKLNPEIKNKMLAIGKSQGYDSDQVKEEYENAQRILHASRSDDHALTRGFSLGK